MVHACNPAHMKAKGGWQVKRMVWTTTLIPGQTGLCGEVMKAEEEEGKGEKFSSNMNEALRSL